MSGEEVVVVGMGQLGTVFAEGLERVGARVVPVRRGDDIHGVASNSPAPALVLVTVAEADFDAVLSSLPDHWRDRVALVQNELLPPDWEKHGVSDPTVAIVWFEKKPDRPLKVLRPTVVGGPQRALLARALRSMDIDVRSTEPGAPLAFELVAKNLYILVTNCAGLQTSGTAGELLSEHRALTEKVAREILSIQEARIGRSLDREGLLADLEAALAADRDHVCRGRSAPARLERALSQAEAFEVPTPTLHSLRAYLAS